MHISPTLLLFLGICAGTLFVTVFTIASAITFRNRRIIRQEASKKSGEKQKIN